MATPAVVAMDTDGAPVVDAVEDYVTNATAAAGTAVVDKVNGGELNMLQLVQALGYAILPSHPCCAVALCTLLSRVHRCRARSQAPTLAWPSSLNRLVGRGRVLLFVSNGVFFASREPTCHRSTLTSLFRSVVPRGAAPR